MTLPILSVAIRSEHDTVAVRQRSRQIARLLGFDLQDQTRIGTAVSEIARNAFRYAGGGRAEFVVEGDTPPQQLLIRITDQGPGIKDLRKILEGRYTSTTGMGLGISGTRRLMDQFDIQTEVGRGTTVVLKKLLPKKAPLLNMQAMAGLTEQLSQDRPGSAYSELEMQNQELLRTLDELRERQEDYSRVNRELEDTNRGVVALYAELDQRADQLRRADELKSRFLSNMSHEFRSPLNSILALTGLLTDHSDGPLTGEQHQQVGFIHRAAEDLYELVNDLLDLAKVEAGKVVVKPAYFEAEKLFGALRGMLRPVFLNTAVTLVFETPEKLPWIYSDEGKVSQILRNFISNALKFTERGEVRVTARHQGGRMLFAVADSGIGIAGEDQERIFQDFAQVDSPMQGRAKGTGLGLPLSRKLAQLLGGEIRVTSVPGDGSIFTLDLPLQYASASETPADAISAIPENGAAGGGPRRVLIIDDDEGDRYVLKHRLRGSGLAISEASSGAEGIAKAIAEHPQLIFLDLSMPEMNGMEVLQALKADPRTAPIAVVIHTSMKMDVLGPAALESGASAILSKEQLSQEDCIAALASRLGETGRILAQET